MLPKKNHPRLQMNLVKTDENISERKRKDGTAIATEVACTKDDTSLLSVAMVRSLLLIWIGLSHGVVPCRPFAWHVRCCPIILAKCIRSVSPWLCCKPQAESCWWSDQLETTEAFATKYDARSRCSIISLLAKRKSPSQSKPSTSSIGAFIPSGYERDEGRRLLESKLDVMAKHPVRLAISGELSASSLRWLA